MVGKNSKTEILNLHSNRKQTRGSKMSEVKKCPKCGGEMEVGYLDNAPYWRHGRSILGVLDGMEESLHINARIAVMWSSILRSREVNVLSYAVQKALVS